MSYWLEQNNVALSVVVEAGIKEVYHGLAFAGEIVAVARYGRRIVEASLPGRTREA